MRFERIVRLGTLEAIRTMALQGHGVAVLPLYFVEPLLRRRRLARIMPRVELTSDWFRLVFRADDARRPLFDWLADRLRAAPLR
jgi:DNA-binding transcriptional LysR family regulator